MATLLLTNIKELLTLSSAAKKQARSVREEDLSIISDAAMIVADGRFVWCGPKKDARKTLKGKKVKTIDLGNSVVLPGFIECHTHSLFGGGRAHEFELRQKGYTYQDIAKQGGGILSTVKATRSESARTLANSFRSRVSRFIAQGVTTLEVKSGYGLDTNSEVKMLKIINGEKRIHCVPTYLGPHAKSPDHSDYQSYLNEIINETLPKVRKHCSRVDIFIDGGYFTIQQAKDYFKKSKELGFSIAIHAEQLSRTGAALLGKSLEALSVDHLVELNDSDIKELADSQTTCVLLPAADYYLNISYPPARKLIDEGARVALATDFNPGTSPTQDLAFVGLLARMQMKMSLAEVIVAYTLGSAHALNLAAEVGSIESGKSADFIVLEGSWRELFYHVGNTPIQSTWTRGKKIYQKKFDF